MGLCSCPNGLSKKMIITCCDSEVLYMTIILFVCLFRDSNAKSGRTAPNQGYNTTVENNSKNRKRISPHQALDEYHNGNAETSIRNHKVTRHSKISKVTVKADTRALIHHTQKKKHRIDADQQSTQSKIKNHSGHTFQHNQMK